MKKTLEMYSQTFESSSGLTEQFADFYKTFKADFRKYIESLGGEKVVFSRGHFEISGFLTFKKQIFYFHFSDLRYFKGFYMRTAKDYKDYSGGSNQDVDMYNFKENVKCIITNE